MAPVRRLSASAQDAIVRVLGAVLALWALDVVAAGEPGLVGAGSTPTRPVGDGVRVVFAATPRLVVGGDPQAHRTWRFRLDGACAVSDGAVLVNCALPGDAAHGGRATISSPTSCLRAAGGGSRSPRVTASAQRRMCTSSASTSSAASGRAPRSGSRLLSLEREAFVNWHSMKRRERGRFPPCHRPWIWTIRGCSGLPRAHWQRRGDTRLGFLPGQRFGLVTGGRPRVLSRCAPSDCLAVVLYRSHAAWIQRIHRGKRGRWRCAKPPSGAAAWRPGGCRASTAPPATLRPRRSLTAGCTSRAVAGTRPDCGRCITHAHTARRITHAATPRHQRKADTSPRRAEPNEAAGCTTARTRPASRWRPRRHLVPAR